MIRCIALALTVIALSGAHAAPYVSVRAGEFRSALPPDGKSANATTGAFEIRALPVTNAEFLAFVRKNPDWRRGRLPALFADANYLRHWEAPDKLGAQIRPDQPVTHVSWFAADAYCRSEHARLPNWYEWERVAAADELRADARNDTQWRDRLLRWYSRPSTGTLSPVARTPRNFYGVYDLHGLVWEWVDDFGSIMVSTDSREQGDPDVQKYCGAGALSVQDRENYAVLMRLAMLSSLQAAYTTGNLGFRCVRPVSEPRK
jgi:formylglycine-generating enzyme required for sulfatase activity